MTENLVLDIEKQLRVLIGLSDHNLACFVVDLYKKNPSAFKSSLLENGAAFDDEQINKLKSVFELHDKQNKPNEFKVVDTTVKHEEGSLREEAAGARDNSFSKRAEGYGRDDKTHGEGSRFVGEQIHIKNEYSERAAERFERGRQVKRERSDAKLDGLDGETKGQQLIAVGEVVSTIVTNLKPFGAFAKIEGSNKTGLIHVSEISHQHVRTPSSVLDIGQHVEAKIVKIEKGKISLSIKQADATLQSHVSDDQRRNHKRKRLTSPERWELRQLIAAGVVSSTDYPELEEDVTKVEKRLDVELKPNSGLTVVSGYSGTQTEPIEQEEKAASDSMLSIAKTGSNLMRESKELFPKKGKPENADDSSQDGVGSRFANRRAPNLSYGIRTKLSMKEQRESLPVFAMRGELMSAIHDNQIVVIVGETGSGKTTQITQYLMEEGYSRNGMIGCTQPRRVAASSVAKRVSEEVGCPLGSTVGYYVRFEDVTSRETEIKYMTDGMLQREALIDPFLSAYSVIMLDEAHERTISTDVLFGLLKKLILSGKRPDLKVIVTSATLDAERFSEYFLDARILKIPGRTFPVDIIFSNEPEFDYLNAALQTCLQIHLGEDKGDILVFLTGQEEIEVACEVMSTRVKQLGNTISELIVLPLYSALPSEVQSKIFEKTPPGTRKVIFATNIAETSITIDGIYYVVDPGYVKVNTYDPKLGMDSLVVRPISQAQANQRAGRAGRTGPGKCFRLYTEEAFKKQMTPSTVPDIQRQNLSNTILQLKAMGIDDVAGFDFMDMPSAITINNATSELHALGAVDESGHLTKLGRKMSDFPMDPSLSSVLLKSADFHCSVEIITIIAMITSGYNVFYRPKNQQNQADNRRARFAHTSGDHLTLLNVYNRWQAADDRRTWCRDNFLHEKSLKKAEEIRRQLTQIMMKNHRYVESSKDNTAILKAICSGFFRNSAKRDPYDGTFKTLVEEATVYMHPSSVLFQKSAEYVVYNNLLLTTKEYMNCVSIVDPAWLIEVAPAFFQVSDNSKQKARPVYNARTKNDEWKISSIANTRRNVLSGRR